MRNTPSNQDDVIDSRDIQESVIPWRELAGMLADLEDITAARDDLPIGPEARQAIRAAMVGM